MANMKMTTTKEKHMIVMKKLCNIIIIQYMLMEEMKTNEYSKWK